MQRLPLLPALSDAQMVNELNTHVLRAGAPSPSVETLLHALAPAPLRRPHPRRRGARRCPTRPTARSASARSTASALPSCPTRWRDSSSPRIRARVPAPGERKTDRHGARLARHRLLRRRGARVLRAHDRAGLHGRGVPAEEKGLAHPRPAQRALLPPKRERDREPAARDLRAGRVSRDTESQCSAEKFRAFAQRPDVEKLSQKGPATPDHLLFTKPVPMIGRDAAAYARATAHTSKAPRGQGAERPCSIRRRAWCSIRSSALPPPAATRARRRSSRSSTTTASTSSCAPRRSAAGAAVGENHLFDIEYWELEQAKLRKAGAAAVPRRGGAGHRRGLGHRQGMRAGVPAARRRGGRPGPQSGDRDRVAAARFPRPYGRPDRRRGGR